MAGTFSLPLLRPGVDCFCAKEDLAELGAAMLLLGAAAGTLGEPGWMKPWWMTFTLPLGLTMDPPAPLVCRHQRTTSSDEDVAATEEATPPDQKRHMTGLVHFREQGKKWQKLCQSDTTVTAAAGEQTSKTGIAIWQVSIQLMSVAMMSRAIS